jgi:AcrR family transcriptional regulator
MTGEESHLPRWKNGLQTSDEIQRLKRTAVLKEAGRAFSKRGYHNTSLDDVAKMLKVSKGTLYNYVKDKQQILHEFHMIAAEIGDRAFAYGRTCGGNGAEILRNTLRHYIHLLTEEVGACGALMEVDALRPQDRAEAVKVRDKFERNWTAVIRTGIKDGSIRNVDPKLAIFTFMGAVNWMPRWFSSSGRLQGREVAEQMTDILLNGLVDSANLKSNSRPVAPTNAPGKRTTVFRNQTGTRATAGGSNHKPSRRQRAETPKAPGNG